MALIVVGGGSRSGKSRYALELARAAGPRAALVATAEAADAEMRERIERHRQERDAAIAVFEEPLHLAETIRRIASDFDAVVLDCLTLWISNRMLRGATDGQVLEEAGELFAASAASPAHVIAVTNEVGCGVVPDNALARRFRDLAGWVNQKAVANAEQAWWMVFGCPLRLK